MMKEGEGSNAGAIPLSRQQRIRSKGKTPRLIMDLSFHEGN